MQPAARMGPPRQARHLTAVHEHPARWSRRPDLPAAGQPDVDADRVRRPAHRLRDPAVVNREELTEEPGHGTVLGCAASFSTNPGRSVAARQTGVPARSRARLLLPGLRPP